MAHRITTYASLVIATTAAVSGCLLSGTGGVGMQLESERAGGVLVKGYQNVADGSEAVTNYSGVRSCGRLPFENAPNGSIAGGLSVWTLELYQPMLRLDGAQVKSKLLPRLPHSAALQAPLWLQPWSALPA